MKDSFLNTCAELIGYEYLDTSVDPPVISPPDIHACSELFRFLHANGQSARVRGAGGYPLLPAGGKQVIVSTTAMHDVRDVDDKDFVIVVDAGAPVGKAVETAEIAGLTFPVDRLYGESMTIGGLFMSGGFRPGMPDSMPFIRKVIGLRGVAANGNIVTFGGRTRKNVTGYEVTRTLAGSMGLFMLATELIIAVQPTPERRSVLRAEFMSGPDMLKSLKLLLMDPPAEPYLMEMSAPKGITGPCSLLTGFQGNRVTVESRIERTAAIVGENGAVSTSKMHDDEALKLRRENVRSSAVSGMTSCSMPRSAVGTYLDRISRIAPFLPLHVYPFDGIVHTEAGKESVELDRVADIVRSLGGKQPVVWDDVLAKGIHEMLTAQEKAFVQSLKTELDPTGILNPGIGLQT